jgi:hypothetical protein
MQSKATTVKDYLAELPADRREAIQAVRAVILKNLDKNYEEGMQYGAISYFVPHRIYPAGHHLDSNRALTFAGLASQKNYMSLGIMFNFLDNTEKNWFKSAWARTGKKLDMGVCCIRFRNVEDLALDVIGELIRRTPAEKYVEQYESVRRRTATQAKRNSPSKAIRKNLKKPESAARSSK